MGGACRMYGVEERWCCRVVGGKREGRRPIGSPWHECVDDIKMDLKEAGWVDVDWIDLALDRGKHWAGLNTLMNLKSFIKCGGFLYHLRNC